MFSPEQLVSLKAVVEEGTVLAAADRLGLTASAVSQQLTRLQKEAGQPVLVRRGRNVVPTDAAEVLVQLASQLEQLDEAARAELEHLTSDVAGPLVLSSFPTGIVGLLAPSLPVLRSLHPLLRITMRELTPEGSLGALRRGEVDLAVVHDWTDYHKALPGGLTAHVLGHDVVDLIAPHDHDLRVGRNGVVDLGDCGGRDWVDDSPGVFSDWLLTALHERSLDYRIAATADTHPSKIALVAAGLGIGLMPRLGRPELPDTVVSFPVRNPPTRRIMLVHRDSSVRRPAVVSVMREVRRVWTEEHA
ncbi:LysR substrate-binding domain-containing protein [Serinicoccus kebangsaanensis]|uniref:LysR substrate-binding domain-containing protein n=1 Tax=Serinicoccus kebangsaanensis TaxID=2602069 RepID=UPI00178C5A14|nr:LysR substrate-binding domain-containing protein [Serinicoccus kebangsaanensis]